ncbi:MAG TPA: S16 family serine protease, partial [Acidimicrobiales bacterium]|nr:S16 family serine protease [Acidimicrobiales bacterium]
NEIAIVPGSATSDIPLITVQRGHAQRHRGSVLLTDVDLVSLRAINYLFYKINPDADIEPKSSVIGTLTPTQYDTEGVIDMSNARKAATVVALRTLGDKVAAQPTGVADYAPDSSNAPASGFLTVGDVITSVNGAPTLSIQQLQQALNTLSPGAIATLTFHAFSSKKETRAAIRLGAVRTTASGEVCLRTSAKSTLRFVKRAGKEIACVGIVPVQILGTIDTPFQISMSAEGIIGPSAGLAFTLGLIQKLDGADLTGGAKIAATGTIAVDGSVGDVGGVAQKTVAVRNAGATVFFVPQGELAVAKAHSSRSLKIFAVSNIAEAIADLKHLGGKVVLPSGR